MNGLNMINAENPWLIPLGDYVSLTRWAEVLAVDPLHGTEREHLSEMQRDMLLALMRGRYEPIASSIEIAATLQTMMWRRYIFANPLVPQNRGRMMQVLGQRGRTLTDAVWMPAFADALMISGCTASGKTTAINRFLMQLLPWYEHRRNDRAEWTSQMQISFLVVPMPVHRGGLLHAILAAIDLTIGTTYRTKYGDRRVWSVEKLAIEVGILLVQHAVGLLVIEEIQARNFSMSPNREEMLLFLLRLLNFGIPIVLVGNPLGFAGLEDFSQDLNRLTENEPIHLMPAEEDKDDWKIGLGASMWEHNLMPLMTPWNDEISASLYECSAGIPGFTRKAAEGSQRLAMRTPGCQAVTLEHLKQYRNESQAYSKNRDLIDGFRLKDPFKLMKFLDVPWEEYGLLWGKLTMEDIMSTGDVGDEVSNAGIDEEEKIALRSVHQNIRRSTAAQYTKRAKKKSANALAKSAASSDDLRSGSTSLLAAGLAALRRNIESKSSHDQTMRKE